MNHQLFINFDVNNHTFTNPKVSLTLPSQQQTYMEITNYDLLIDYLTDNTQYELMHQYLHQEMPFTNIIYFSYRKIDDHYEMNRHLMTADAKNLDKNKVTNINANKIIHNPKHNFAIQTIKYYALRDALASGNEDIIKDSALKTKLQKKLSQCLSTKDENKVENQILDELNCQIGWFNFQTKHQILSQLWELIKGDEPSNVDDEYEFNCYHQLKRYIKIYPIFMQLNDDDLETWDYEDIELSQDSIYFE